jgi:hypothetical protein
VCGFDPLRRHHKNNGFFEINPEYSTQNGCRSCHQAYRRRQKFVPTELAPEISEIPAPTKRHAPIGIYTPDEIRVVLAAASAEIIPALAMAVFAVCGWLKSHTWTGATRCGGREN